MSALVHVAVAIITNPQDQVLISLRSKDVHQGDLWEFPGGKLEQGESVYDALKREIYEELNITVLKARPFKTIQYKYPHSDVLLDIWMVESFSGKPESAEGQPIKWQNINQLNVNEFPAANRAIIQSLILPDKYMITGSFENQDDFESRLKCSLQDGISLLQLRCKNLPAEAYKPLAIRAKSICKKYRAKLLLNTELQIFQEIGADGLHLSSQFLHSFSARPVADSILLSVSCHTEADIQQARQLKADILLLSPVKETRSHAGVKGIGWEKFSALTSNSDAPVYALGGMAEQDLADAKAAGAQGVAAISSFWRKAQK